MGPRQMRLVGWSTMKNFKSGSTSERNRQRAASKMAKAAGWRAVGSAYVHENGTKYPMKDLDGWADLCEVEGIEQAQPL